MDWQLAHSCVAWRRRSFYLLLGAGIDLSVGNHRTRSDATDHPPVAEREHGGDRFHHQFAALALRKYPTFAGSFATAAVASPCPRRAGFVLWIVPDDVVMESAAEIKPSTDYTDIQMYPRNLWMAFLDLQFDAKGTIVPTNQMVGESFHPKWLSG